MIHMLSEWNCKTQQNVLIDVKCNRYVTLKITLSLHILQKNIEIYIYIYIENVNYAAVFLSGLEGGINLLP